MWFDFGDIKSFKECDWGYEGIVVYFKICIYVGCLDCVDVCV